MQRAAVATTGAPEHLPAGTRIRVHGLAAKPEYNGQKGFVLSWDDAKGRVGIKLTSGSKISLKPANVEVVKSSDVSHEDMTIEIAMAAIARYEAIDSGSNQPGGAQPGGAQPSGQPDSAWADADRTAC